MFEINPQVNQARSFPRRVFFTGSTAVYRGQAVCYRRDFTGTPPITGGTSIVAGDQYGVRDKFVAQPTSSNNRFYAGCATADYAAVTGGQWIEIIESGSVGLISTLIATTVGSTKLTALCSSAAGVGGRYVAAGFKGKGTALAMQTLTAITDIAGTTPGVIGSSLDGTATIATSGTTYTVTKTGAFTYAAAGDKLVIVAGATTTTMATGTTVGEYTIATRVDANSVTLTTQPTSAAASICFYLIRGNPVILAKLDEGEESGMAEWITPISATAVEAMVGGMTYIMGGATITTDCTHTLANGDVRGLRKGYLLGGALTTADYEVTVTSGEQLDGTTDLAGMQFDGAADESELEWFGKWRLVSNAGTGLS